MTVVIVREPYVSRCFQICVVYQSQQFFQLHSYAFSLLFYCQNHTQGEFCVIFKQGVAPCGAPAFFVCCVRYARCSSAPSLCTACCVCQIHAVAVKLCHQFCVSCFAAACTCAGEFQQRLFELRTFYAVFVHRVLLIGQSQREVPVRLFVHLCIQRFHYQCFFFCGTCCYADTTALAVQRIHLDAETILSDFASAFCRFCYVAFGGVLRFFFCQQERTDTCVRTYVRTLVTLDTFCCIPFRNVDGNTTFFVSGSTQRYSTVFSANEYGYGQGVAFQCVHGNQQFFNVFRQNAFDFFFVHVFCVFPAFGNVDLHQTCQTCVYGRIVHVNDFFTFFAVRFFDGCFHVANCVINGDDVCQFEECGLQNGVCSVAQTDFTADFNSVDGIEIDVVVCDVTFYFSRQMFFQFFAFPAAVQQESTAGFDFGNDIIFGDVGLVVACHKVCFEYQIAGADRHITETQVRFCDTAGFFGVIFKVCLCVFICMVTDDLDGVFVCTNSTVGAQTPEFACDCACVCYFGFCANFDGCHGNVVNDTNGEVVFLFAFHVVKDSNNLCGCYVFGGQTVSACQYQRSSACFCQCGTYILIQRFAQCAGFFCSVQNGNDFCCFRQCAQEMFQGERTVQVNLQETNLFAFCCQVFYNFLCSACDGAHSDQNVFCVGCAEVVEQLIVSACDFVDFVHVVFHDFRQTCIERCLCFSVLEEYVRVLYGRTLYGMFRVQRVFAEFAQCVFIQQFCDVFVVHNFDFLQFVRSTETVEEMHERYAAFDGCQMCYAAQVHNFLYGSGGKHCHTNLTTSHNVGMVAEDGESMCTNGSGAYMEYAGFELTGNTVNAGDHQQQTLRSCVCSCQSTSFQCAVHSTCGTCFGFHFYQTYCLTEDVLLAVCRPAVNVFCHGRRGGNGVNGSYFCKCVRDISSCFIPVHGFHNFCVHGKTPFI